MDDSPPSFSSLGMSPAEGRPHQAAGGDDGRRSSCSFLTFAAFYFAIGPGNFFSTDEVRVEETAQAVLLTRSTSR
jgi:hypothetical protein